MVRFGASCRRKNMIPPEGRHYPVPFVSELPKGLIRLDPWEADYLFMLGSLAREGIVEIGRLSGGSTFLLSCANGKVPIWSIDVAPTSDPDLLGWFAAHGVGSNTHLLVGDSRRDDFRELGGFDLLFVDGDHTYEGCLGDLERYFAALSPGGHVLVHDCYAGNVVQQAVLDFMAATPVEIIRSPYIPDAHWHTDHGSIAHLRKPAG